MLMKANIFLFLFLLMSSVGFAQSDTKLYYSIDSRGFSTAEERNQYEEKLETQLLYALTTITSNNSEAAGDCLTVKKRIESDFKTLKSMREYEERINSSFTPKIYDTLKSKGIEMTPTRAINNELFSMSEMANCVDVSIDEFLYFSKWVQTAAKAKKYTSPFGKAFEKRDAVQSDKFQKYEKALDEKAALIAKILNEKADEEDAKSGKVKTSYLVDNGYLFYSLDGREYETQADRDSRNEELMQSMMHRFTTIDSSLYRNGEYAETMSSVVRVIFSQILILDDWMAMLDSKPHYNDLVALVNKTAPGIELGIYQSKNKETFFLQEMADSYDRVCSMYAITNMILEADAKAENKDAITDIEEPRDADGKNILMLFDESKELMGKVNEKYELMDKL